MKIFFSLLIPAMMVWSCGENKNVRETVSTTASDSLVTPRDSVVVVKEAGDPNVYTIPADYPWLVKLIGERFPWDSASTCTRITAFDDLFSEASITKDQIGDDLVAVYEFRGSYVKVAQLHFDEMQDCMDNICEVVLTSDWVPIGLGLHIGMRKAEFLETLGLEKSLSQHTFNYVYKLDNTHSITVVFEFKDDVLAAFSYAADPCKSYPLPVPRQPL